MKLGLDHGHLRITLRDYQEQALTLVAEAKARGVRRQLGVAATGLGKTVIFSALAERTEGRTLILAHRDELVRQAADKVLQVWPEADVGIVKAGSNEVSAQVVIGSVQTLARENRLTQLTDAGDFALVVVDEAHHTAAESYRTILDAVDAGLDGGPLLLGVTATPDRGDGKGLDDLFDEITFTHDILWGIRSGYLCDVRGLRVRIDALDLAAVKMQRGDFHQGQAGMALADAHGPEAISAAWHEHALGRRTLVFTPTVETARLTAEQFRHRGTSAEFVYAGTPLEDRRAMLHRFSTGETQVIANCAVLTEGFDEPRVDCIVVARPTRNRALFTQMVGRGTRKHPDKDDLLVLDVVGATEVLSLVTLPSLFGVEDPDLRASLADGSGSATEVAAEHDRRMVAIGRMRAEEANLFGPSKRKGIVWANVTGTTPGGERRYERSLGGTKDGDEWIDYGMVVLVEKEPYAWLAGVQNETGKHVLIHGVSLELAQGVAEDFVRRALGSRLHLVDASAPWRQRPPSERALHAARKWRLPRPDQYETAGALSDALDEHIARKRARERAKATGA